MPLLDSNDYTEIAEALGRHVKEVVTAVGDEDTRIITAVLKPHKDAPVSGQLQQQKLVRNERGGLIPHGPVIDGTWKVFREDILARQKAESKRRREELARKKEKARDNVPF